jgi:hypothetical protein
MRPTFIALGFGVLVIGTVQLYLSLNLVLMEDAPTDREDVRQGLEHHTESGYMPSRRASTSNPQPVESKSSFMAQARAEKVPRVSLFPILFVLYEASHE